MRSRNGWRPTLSLASLIALSGWQGRGLLGGALLGLLAGAGARFFATASLGQDDRVLIDLLLAVTTLGSLIITWLLAGNLTAAEQERGTALLLVSKPLSAGQYALGRWLGLVLGGSLIFITSALVGTLVASWGHPLPLAELALTWLVSGGELIVLAALASFFASWTTATLASLLTLALWFSGHSLDILVSATGWTWLGYILPNFSRFNLHETYVQATALHVSYYLWIALYALAWSAALIALSAQAVKKRAW